MQLLYVETVPEINARDTLQPSKRQRKISLGALVVNTISNDHTVYHVSFDDVKC